MKGQKILLAILGVAALMIAIVWAMCVPAPAAGQVASTTPEFTPRELPSGYLATQKGQLEGVAGNGYAGFKGTFNRADVTYVSAYVTTEPSNFWIQLVEGGPSYGPYSTETAWDFTGGPLYSVSLVTTSRWVMATITQSLDPRCGIAQEGYSYPQGAEFELKNHDPELVIPSGWVYVGPNFLVFRVKNQDHEEIMVSPNPVTTAAGNGWVAWVESWSVESEPLERVLCNRLEWNHTNLLDPTPTPTATVTVTPTSTATVTPTPTPTATPTPVTQWNLFLVALIKDS